MVRTETLGGRLVLVISAQCPKMGDLDFLPDASWRPGESIAAERQLPMRLYEQFVGPEAGRCRPVPGLASVPGIQLASPGLVVNPTVAAATEALHKALAEAHAAEAALVIHYLGHGYAHTRRNGSVRHFLQLRDTAERPANAEAPSMGWDPYEYIDEVRDEYPHMSGLVMLIDACYASTAVPTLKQWIDVNVAFPFVWLGSSQVTQAFDGCFSQVVQRVIAEGIARDEHARHNLVADLGAADLVPALTSGCTGQEPATVSSQDHDPVLFIAGNRAAERRRVELGVDSITGQTIARLLEGYQPSGLEELAAEARGHPLAVFVGDAGSGKSTLAAALRDPPEETGLLSVDALAFVTATSTTADLAVRLSEQLRTMHRFGQAIAIFEHSNRATWLTMSRAEQVLLGPLGIYDRPVTLVFDGLDQLSTVAGPEVRGLIADLGEHAHIRIIATSRPGEILLPEAHVIEMPATVRSSADKFLADIGIVSEDRDPLIELAAGNWLLLELAARQQLRSPGIKLGSRAALYSHIIEQAMGRQGDSSVLAVLTVLSAVSGPGPLVPFPILANAVRRLGGPSTRSDLYGVLGDGDLSSVLARANATAANEHVGVFHATLVQELAGRDDITPRLGHQALLQAIEELAPVLESERPAQDGH